MSRNGFNSGISPEGLSQSRRQFLAAGLVGGSAMLAGCSNSADESNGGNGNGELGNGGSVPEGGHVEGQELILPTEQNPEELHFVPFHEGVLQELNMELQAATTLQPALYGTGMFGRIISGAYEPNPGELYPALFEDFTLEPQKMTITIREDANWSDGEPLRAFDVAAPFALHQPHITSLSSDNPSLQAEDPEEAEFFPVQDITMPDGEDGKVVEYHNWDWDEFPAWEEVNGFEYPSYQAIYGHLLGPTRRRAALFPTHVEPWKSILRDRWEWRQEHKLMSDDPQPHPLEGVAEYMADRLSVEDVRATREEGGIPTCGAWQLEEVRGAQEIVLKPNEHHYAADEINFDRVRFEWNEEPRRTRSSLHSENLDYASVRSSPEEMQSYPDQYVNINSPYPNGHAISLDHSTEFGDVRVRQAMMYALNKEQIAQNVHPEARQPVQIPGWDMWAVEAAVSEEWAQENLIDYSQDTDRAAELMQEAGFERQDGIWTRDGEPLSTELPTSVETPVWEETVAQQLTDFGIEVNVRSMDEATFEDRWAGSTANERIEEEYGGNGDFKMWQAPEGVGTGSAGFYTSSSDFWYNTINNRSKVRAHNFYDHDAQEESILLTDEDEGDGYGTGGWSWMCAPGCHAEWTIDLPPIGEPDGEPEPFGATYVRQSEIFSGRDPSYHYPDYQYYNPPQDEEHEENAEYHWKKFLWTMNYYLPALPLALRERQHFFNSDNWVWPTDHDMWEYFGMDWAATELVGMGQIWADPENPKEGTNVVDE